MKAKGNSGTYENEPFFADPTCMHATCDHLPRWLDKVAITHMCNRKREFIASQVYILSIHVKNTLPTSWWLIHLN